MAETTENGVYKPKNKIVIASSFEGIVNDGATECALTSFNAYYKMTDKFTFFLEIIEPEDFETIRDDKNVKAFLLLRPFVEIAEDYLTVMQLIGGYPAAIYRLIENPEEEKQYEFFREKFEDLKIKTENVRTRFKEEFYKERKRMQNKDYSTWLNIQSPFPESIAELRYLIRTQERDKDKNIVSGFIPYFATSKDEKSTFDLCKFYSTVKKLDPEDVSEDGTKECIIVRGKIIGKERTRNKLQQVKMISDIEGISPEQVWRVNDRYDKEQQKMLRESGFVHQFLLKGGYAFPFEYETAEKEGIVVLDRTGFAKALGKYAKEHGF